ncbi:MAG: ABC transporter permease [Nocardioidaceae bacterium]|nr:ABC transporter permease [Nocardioidaceae bacterium]
MAEAVLAPGGRAHRRFARFPARTLAPTSRTVRRLAGIVAMFAAWELLARRSDNRLIPTLNEIWDRLLDDVRSGDLWFNGRLTLTRGLIGLLIALVAGVAIGLAMGANRWIERTLQPILSATYPAPKLALYPVFILLLGLGAAPKIVLVALECLYPIVYNTHAGARAITRDLMWHTRNAEATRRRRLVDVAIPATLPSILTGLRIAAPIMLIVMVVTEMIGESRGLGFMIMDARANFQPAGVFSVIIVLGVLGFVIDRIIVAVLRAVVFWEQEVTL